MADPTPFVFADQFRNISDTAPVAPAPLEPAVLEQGKRRLAVTGAQQREAMFNQDNTLTGLLNWRIGSQFAPEAGYNPAGDPKGWEELTAGVRPEFQHELAEAVSPAHALWLKDRLLTKQNELQTLGDLSTLGQVGRFGYGLLHGMIDPINIPTLAMATPARFLGKLAFAAGGGIAQEKVRQATNYENNNNQLLDAALTSGIFAAPFAALSSAGRRMQERAMREKAVLEKQEAGLITESPDYNAERSLIREEQRAANSEQWDLLEQLEDIRIEAEKEQLFRQMRGEDLDLDVTSPGETPVRVKLKDGVATEDFPTKTPMQIALEKAGLVQERERIRAEEQAKAEADARVKAAAEQQKQTEASWANFFKQVDESNDSAMLKAAYRTPQERADAATQGPPRRIEDVGAELPLLEQLNRVVQGMVAGGRAAFDARPLLHVDAGLQALAAGFQNRFGKRIVFFRDASGQNRVDGTFVRQLGDTLFVRADHPRVAELVAFHELFHSLRQAAPERYNALVAQLRGALQNFESFKQKFNENQKKQQLPDLSDSKVLEEFLAESSERLFRDPEFQKFMARREGGALRQFLADVLDYLSYFVEKLVGNRGLPADPALVPYVSSINRFRREMAKFIMKADYEARQAAKADGADLSVAKATGRVPEKTVKAYKLFRIDPRSPGRLFPLFVNADKPVPIGEWIDAESGPQNAKGGVKSKIGDLAYRPGWHAGDLPLATHIGGKSGPDKKAPDVRPPNQVWAEVEMSADVDWQTVANQRGMNKEGRVVPVKAHITDQMPVGGHYRYKTNPNMTGNWLIGGEMRVNRVLTDEEVASINSAAGLSDLPRVEPSQWDYSAPVVKNDGEAMMAAAGRALGAPVVPQSAPLQTTWANARLDYTATIFKGTNEVHKDIVNRMVRDVLGGDGTNTQGWTASEWATSIIRRASFPAHAEMQKQFNLAAHDLGWGWWKRQTNNREFYEAVSRVKRGDMSPIEPGGAFEKVAAQVKAAAAAADKAYAMVLKELQDSGVKGADAVTHDPKYVNRVWRQDKLKDAIMRYGQGAVFQMVANSFSSPELRGDVLKGEQFVKAIMRLEYTPAMRELTLQSPDMKRLRNELDAAGLTPDDADLIVEVMLGQKTREPDAGQATNLRGRMGLEEGLAHQMPDGSTMRVTDFFENDIRVLMDNYVRTLAGHAGMARQGIPDAATFEKMLNEARTEHETQGALFGGDSSSFNRNEQHLRDLYDVLTGRPMSHQTFNRFDRILAGLRGLTRGAMLGQLGVAQALELNNAAGMFGLRAAMHHSPGLAALIRQARRGAIVDDTLQQQLQHMFGTGMEMSAAYMRDNEYSDFAYGRGPDNTFLDKLTNRVEKAGNAVSHGIDVVSGNRLFTSFTRSFATRWAIQQMVDQANGRGPGVSRERFKGLGLSEADIDPFLTDLRTYAKVDPKGTVHEIDWEAWQQNNPQSYDQFTLVTMRRVRDAIQDHDVGETMPWMHTTLGKVFSELRTFMLVAHGKQFLKNAHYRDREAFQLFTLSLVAQALGYTVQASVNNADNQERREKALEPDRIAKAAIQRMSITGVLPMLFESGHWVATGGQSFFGGGSFNTDSRNFLMTPSMTMATRAMEAAKVVGGAVNPWSDAVTTQKEMRSLYGLLPGSNTYLVRNLISQLVEDLPKSEVGQRP